MNDLFDLTIGAFIKGHNRTPKKIHRADCPVQCVAIQF
jgi:hypothetical protein